jgi:hypothetical protein
MESDFSEFSYGYAAIREAELGLSTIYKQAGAPKLPSLVEEEKLGYDVRIAFVDFVLFLQFKRSTWVSRRHPNSPTWPGMLAPHYRYSIDTDGHQHQALIDLENELAGVPGLGSVYYTAPVFHSQHDFDSSYGSGQVLSRSTLVPPGDIGLADGTHHVVSVGFGPVTIMSEPRSASRATNWDLLEGVARQRAQSVAGRASGSRFTIGDLEAVLERSVHRLERDIVVDDNAPVVSRLHRSAALLGCGLALVTLEPSG